MYLPDMEGIRTTFYLFVCWDYFGHILHELFQNFTPFLYFQTNPLLMPIIFLWSSWRWPILIFFPFALFHIFLSIFPKRIELEKKEEIVTDFSVFFWGMKNKKFFSFQGYWRIYDLSPNIVLNINSSFKYKLTSSYLLKKWSTF